MPPIYDYTCEQCGLKTTVVRSVPDMAMLPGEVEGESALKDATCKTGDSKHRWVKQFGSFTLTRGKNWSGSKGHW